MGWAETGRAQMMFGPKWDGPKRAGPNRPATEENDTTCDTYLSQANCALEWMTFFLCGLFVAIIREIHSNKLFFGCNTIHKLNTLIFQHKLNTLIMLVFARTSLSCRHRDLSTPSNRIIVLRGRSSFSSLSSVQQEIERKFIPVQ